MWGLNSARLILLNVSCELSARYQCTCVLRDNRRPCCGSVLLSGCVSSSSPRHSTCIQVQVLHRETGLLCHDVGLCRKEMKELKSSKGTGETYLAVCADGLFEVTYSSVSEVIRI